MAALSRPLVAPATNEMRWLRVEEPSAAGACRAAAVAMAGALGFPAERAGQLGLAVTEAATNLHKHANAGSLMLRASRDAEVACVEMVTIDSGPGVSDVRAAMRDGHSTSGTLGIGLGVIGRMADFSDIYSRPGRGTVLVARFFAAPALPAVDAAGLTRPITGEAECGDSYATVRTGGLLTAMLCDGLGHGPHAAAAAREAVAALLDGPSEEPASVLGRIHQRLGRSRGGAVAVVQVEGRTVRFAGLGNVAAWLLSADSRSGMSSVPGIAGHQARRLRQFEYELPERGVVVLHSDGLSSRWDVRDMQGLASRDPLVIAAVLLAEAGVHRDDAGVLVLTP